ncbi:prolyl oligopeptidase family serine peptidase [Catenovulum sp. 2E275]|uniref:alpha/beta hydrolase family protein n=1 Tax=Catenovulum sp. 2E275 TaxID=2980497 RepID=UPI0021D2A96E|nr:prolyl oligopeptidase family serine peptidase [Catenovulum sp. 2E275]MCU4674861.1 prolyl oligopeptidase family serine peptidase [Catenovulum sp. 2E275]
MKIFCHPLILLLFTLISFNSHSAQIPISAFASKPDVTNVRISPDGKYVAQFVSINDQGVTGTGLHCMDIKAQDSGFVTFTDDKKFIMLDFEWLNNQDILITVKYPAARYGTPVDEIRVIKVNIFDKKITPILTRTFLKQLNYVSNVLSDVVDYLEDEPEHILMSIPGKMTGTEPSVYKLSINGSNRYETVQYAKEHVHDWITDQQHNVRIGIYREDTHYKILEKSPTSDSFRTLWEFNAFSQNEIWPLGFDIEPNILYVRALHQGKTAVFRVDLNDPKLPLTLVHAHSNYDVSTKLVRSYKTGEVIGVGNHIWDSSYKQFLASIDKALPDTKNKLVSMSKNENQYVIYASSNSHPGMYLLGDKKEKYLSFLSSKYAALNPENLANKTHIEYKARDNLVIEGYLTKPKHTNNKPLPTIIFPHGGPISQNINDFDYWSQFLASRGYAVVQMNFRGSYGRGFEFMQHGLAAWGQAMQDDVEDAALWAIKESIADPEKICILGASYGGYAAMMGIIKSPKLYQCAVSFAGISDIEQLVRASKNFTNFELVKKQVGDDYSKLWQHSPLKYAEQINVPLLLIHGKQDRSVRVEQSQEMYDELKDFDKTVSYLELPNADHYLSNTDDRLKVFTEIAEFLDTYLK